MKKQEQSQEQGKSLSQIETILRQGNWNSQSDANAYLQKHGLSCQMRDDGKAIIFDDSSQGRQVATVNFQSSDPGNRQISNVTT